MEKLPKRFSDAVSKLYNAFHNGELNAMDCKACACGNICDNSSVWAMSKKEQFGYSPMELAEIEQIFMFGLKKCRPISPPKGYVYDGMYGWSSFDVNSKENNELVFHALCAVVEYLCELDNIPNIMDYTCLFETENNKPKYELYL